VSKDTEIVLAVGGVVVALYAANQLAQGANQAEQQVGNAGGQLLYDGGMMVVAALIGFFLL
jgi:nitrogenase subunit NifH